LKRNLLLLGLALAGGLVAQTAVQPLPFSHKTHTATAKLRCQDCHPSPTKFGAEMGFPAVNKCMACHVLIAKDKPAIRKLAEFAAAKQPVPWVRVYQLADFVFFDHRFHLMNQAKCEDCHGPIGERDVTADEMNATKMAFCQGCHARNQASNSCGTCHNIR
jgi:hypothetical protein